MFFFYGEGDSESGGGVSLADWSNFTETKLTASDKADTDRFGYVVSTNNDGSIVVVSSVLDDPNGISNAGSAYVFEKQNGSWVEVQKLTASDPAASDYFSNPIAISGDGSTIAVSAEYKDPDGVEDAGTVYIFQKQNGSWLEVQKLTASDRQYKAHFGNSISFSDDGSVLAIAAYWDDSGFANTGAVYIFQNNGGTWTEVQKLTASDKAASDFFGNSVSISGDGTVLAVGARGEDPNSLNNAGSAYIFQNNGGTWTEVQKLTASDKAASDLFGWDVSISGDGTTVAVGSFGADPDGISDAGAVYIFQEVGGTWSQSEKLTASDKEQTDRFGQSISLNDDGSTLVVSSEYVDPDGVDTAGAAYIFQNNGSTWTEVQKLTASDKQSPDRMGRTNSISADGSMVVIGAPDEDPDGVNNAGSVYIFQVS